MIERDTIVTICLGDIAGQVRGKGFPASQLQDRRRFGVGWTPTNVMINCFGRIPATPFGSTGDLMLVPAEGGDIRIDFGEGGAVEHSILGNVVTMAGEPWACCLRGFLKQALDLLESEAGLKLVASFEHELWIDHGEERPGDSYAISTLRGLEGFFGDVLGALRANDIKPDTVLPEYGPRQYELTVDPAAGLAAADQSAKFASLWRFAMATMSVSRPWSPGCGGQRRPCSFQPDRCRRTAGVLCGGRARQNEPGRGVVRGRHPASRQGALRPHGTERDLLRAPETPLDTNDLKFAMSPGWMAGDDFFAYLRSAFDQLYREGEREPKMMSIGLHARLTGRPGRTDALARFMDHVQSHADVWVCRRVEIARHWMAHHPVTLAP